MGDGFINKKVVANYYYQDEFGKTIYRIQRREWEEAGENRKDFLSFNKADDGWKFGIGEVKRYLYKLPQVLKAIEKEEYIFFVEGEKCVHQVNALGLIGTTSPFGSKSWKGHAKSYLPYLKGAKLIIIPDNDKTGREFAEEVYRDVNELSKSVFILELPGLNEKEDIVEWVQAGGSRDALLKLVEDIQYKASDCNEEFSFSVPVFENQNCYFRAYKDKEIQISNFVIKPKYIVEGEEMPQMEAEVVCEDGQTFDRVFSTEDFDDVLYFKKALKSFNVFFTGRVEDLQYIRHIISRNKCTTKKGVNYMGFHKLNGGWCFAGSSGALNDKLTKVDNIAVLDAYEELSTELLNYEPISMEELVALSLPLFRFNTLKITSTILGYVCGLFLKGKLESLNIKYNHLLIEGQSGSGKSQTIENVVAPLLGLHRNVLNAGECSSFALYRAVSSSNFVPLILDEYKPQRIGKVKVDLISNIMRNSYDGHKVLRGLPNMKKNREYTGRASVILCGEVGVEETANIERSLKLVFSAANHSKERSEYIKFMRNYPQLLSKLGRSLLNGGLKMSEEKLIEIYQAIYEKLSGKEFENERIKNSITNCILGIALLKGVFDELDLSFEEAVGVKLKDIFEAIREAAFADLLSSNTSSKGILEDTLETINRMAINGLLEKDYDYDAVIDSEGDAVLRLNYSAFYDRFLKFCREHSVDHEVLPLNSFKKQLGKLKACKCYNKPTTFLVRGGRINERRTFRAAILKADELKELEIEFLLGTGAANL